MKFKMVTGTRTVNTTAPVNNNNGKVTENVPPSNNTQIPPVEPVKKPSDNRRSNKPIMEKRRRARINNCLNELKTLILDAMKKDPARHSKLEKADILEMTVKHLENLQRQQAAMSQVADPNIVNKFKAGFTECANEVGRFPGIEPTVKRRLLQHLSNCINGVKSEIHYQNTQIPQHQQNTVQVHILPSPPSSPEQDQQQQHQIHTQQIVHSQQAQSQITATSNGYFLTNNNGSQGVQLIPTKLSNGNIAFVVPQQVPEAPLPMLIPIPTRTSSTASAASSTSSNFENRIPRDSLNMNNNNTTSPKWYGPPSPSSHSYESLENSNHSHSHIITTSSTKNNLKRPHSPVPLSLVMKKQFKSESDEKPWRPW